MAAMNKLLNVVLPPLLFILLCIFMLPLLLFKLLLFVKKMFQRQENLEVEGKVVLITGAASGIGEQIAYEYARRGAHLSLVDIREENLEAVADKAKSLGSPDVTIIGADVSKSQDCKRFVDQTVNYFGRLDHLVNNAGVGGLSGVKDWRDDSKFTRMMDVNFWGAVYGTLNAIPHLKRSKGRIIVIASAAGWFPLPKMGVYSASKGAVINFFETLRTELGHAITITIATPGFIKTDLALRTIDEEAIIGRIPMESASECAKAIVKSACRGDMYVTHPLWVKGFYPWRVLFPEVMEWGIRLLLGVFYPKTNRKKGNLHLSNDQLLKAE